MSNKTCGECRYYKPYNDAICPYQHRVVMPPVTRSCSRFEQITNGDMIRNDGNKAIAKFAYKTARTHIRGVCAFSTIEQGKYVCTAKDGLSCVDGIEAYLNAPAKEGEDE